MREIKFRGKRVDNGEWVYGAFVPDALEQTHSDMVSWGFIRRYNGSKSEMIEVDRKTVGQYTGLKDKTGKAIYEGDIVTGLFDHTDIIGHIIYGSDATFFIYRKGLYGIGLNNAEDWLEVIGNIYENPELLE